MKIALFHCLPSGGAKRTLYEQIKRLSRKHKFDLYTLKNADERYLPLSEFLNQKFEFKFKESSVPHLLFFLNPILSVLKIFHLEHFAKIISERINQGNYDLAYVTHGLPTPCPSIVEFLKISSIYYCHEPPRRFYESELRRGKKSLREKFTTVCYSPREYLLKTIDKTNVKFVKKVITNSFYNKKIIDRIYNINSEVLYHGVDTEKFIPINIPKENLVISVGALEILKGHEFIIRALTKLKIKPKFIVIADRGQPSEERILNQLANEKNIELQILKNISDEKLVEIYNRAKITLCAQIREPFGIVALESMSCGTPVVGVNEGGLKESILDKKTGILVQREENEFSKAIQLLLENETIRIEYGKNCREYILKNWTWSKAVEKLEKKFYECIDLKNG